MKSYFSFLIIFLVMTNCEKIVTEPTERPSAQVDFGFETDFQDWLDLGGSGESAFDTDITLTEEVSSSGNKSVKFIVSPGSYVANGNRAELTYDDGASEDSDKWYSWKIYLPEDYSDVSMRDDESEPNWQIMGQWHQQPVVEDGETWEEFTGKGESPPVGINYYFLGKDDSYYQNLKNDEDMRSIPGYDPNWDDVSVFFITYGTPPLPVGVSRIEKGNWISILVNIYWSQKKDGYVRVWIDGKEVTDGKTYGTNMWNRASHYFKFGLYRNPDIPHTQSLYYDDVKIGFSREQVE